MGLSDNGYHLMSYAYSYENNSVSKWDTIQSDIADAYLHLDDELELENEETEEEYFGIEIISLDELSDTELEEMEII